MAPTSKSKTRQDPEIAAIPEITEIAEITEGETHAPGPVIYRSRDVEAQAFTVMGIRPTRNFATGRLEWVVPATDAPRFAQNHFVTLGRVERKPE